ncbi:DNA N-6-adenine-methyltransferase [Chroococcidiopsis sp.]|uniref:DNA N-6-adenine-methyltransferase n=1 Tax=Chroococcidiopsis sp. TaxID=3088168 RepID=UPI003F316D15
MLNPPLFEDDLLNLAINVYADPFFASKRSDEWYTPYDPYLIKVKNCLEGIELDPASCYEANRILGADRYYTQEMDGLSQAWDARSVFCNPPFSLAKPFLQKMIQSYRDEAFQEGIFLCNAATSERWFQDAYNYPMCFTNHRMRFVDQYGNIGKANTKGQVFIYFGTRLERFNQSFSSIGRVMVSV